MTPKHAPVRTLTAIAVLALGAGLVVPSTARAATPKAGSTCTKVGQVSGGLTCKTVGKKKLWQAGAPAATTATTAAAAPATTAAAATGGLPAGEYKVGFEALKSGPAAFAGVPLSQGVELAVDEINSTGFLGKGATIKLLTEDSGGATDKAIAAFNKFTAEKVSGVICCALSSQAGAIKPLAKAAKIPAIVDSAVLLGLNEPPYMYRPVLLLGLPNGVNTQLIKTYVAKRKPATAVVAITADNQGMKEDAAVWKSALEANGVTVLKTIDTGAADTDLTGPATQIIDLKPDLVVNSMLGGPGTRLIKTLRGRGYKAGIVSNYGIADQSNYDIGGDSLAGVIYPIVFYAPNPVNDVAKNFVALYKAKYKEDPSIYPAQGYTAMWQLAMGMKASGDGKSDNVAQALSKMTTMKTVYGDTTIKDGQSTLVGEALYLEWTKDGYARVWSGF